MTAQASLGTIRPMDEPSKRPPRYPYFGRTLREGMRRSGVTIADVVRELGVSRETVRLWREGKNVPRDENLRRLAIMIGVDPKDLRFEPGRKPKLPALKGEHVTDEDELALLRAYRGLKKEWAREALRMRAVELLEEFGEAGSTNPFRTKGGTQ